VGHEIFSYEAYKNGTVRIFWEGRCVMTLGGDRAGRLVCQLEDADEEHVQYLLRRATGNFKRGNERHARRR
jgi:hypothetical protein